MMSLSMDEKEKRGCKYIRERSGWALAQIFMGSAACRTKLATVWQCIINSQVKGAEQKRTKLAYAAQVALLKTDVGCCCILLMHFYTTIADIVVPYDHAMQHNVLVNVCECWTVNSRYVEHKWLRDDVSVGLACTRGASVRTIFSISQA